MIFGSRCMYMVYVLAPAKIQKVFEFHVMINRFWYRSKNRVCTHEKDVSLKKNVLPKRNFDVLRFFSERWQTYAKYKTGSFFFRSSSHTLNITSNNHSCIWSQFELVNVVGENFVGSSNNMMSAFV